MLAFRTHLILKRVLLCDCKEITMSTFVSQVNRMTGKIEWIFRENDYDYQQEIARSSYADMLHDTERNKLYYKALKVAIAKKRCLGQCVHVLDIGTGTGLLSMMAAALGADTVHACEAFRPIAQCAKKIIKENGYAEKIKVISKRSTGLVIGEDIPQRANILVTEVFDTELIGEGAIGTFVHAHMHLLEKDCIVVPSYGNLYIQLVTSDLVRRWNQIDEIVMDDTDRITFPTSISRCSGASSLHDLQLDQLPLNTFTKLTEPMKAFRFDFSGKTELPYKNMSILDCVMLNSGKIDGMFVWWDLEMDPDSEILLSCAPRWAHPNPRNMQWRDHWMQAIYYPTGCQKVAKGDTKKVICKHDEYSLWFDVSKDACLNSCPDLRPVCTCGTHITYSRCRIGMLSDPARRDIYTNVLRKYITPEKVCLCISDGSLLPLIAAKLGAKHVYTIEANPLCNRVMHEFVNHNQLQDKITILDQYPENVNVDVFRDTIDIVLGEPVFQTSILPWDNMLFWYQIQQLTNHITEDTVILPGKMVIYAVAVDYNNLWKIRADIGNCEGFNLQEFDKIIQITSDAVDENIEPHPLWEYPCRASGPPVPVLELDFTKHVDLAPTVDQCVRLNVDRQQSCNGVAMWVEFIFDGRHVISTGPQQEIRTGFEIDWDHYSKQGVHLFNKHKKVFNAVDTYSDCCVDIHLKFIPKDGHLGFQFQPSWSPSLDVQK